MPLGSQILQSSMSIRKARSRGNWVAQSVDNPTVGFSSGHDLMVHGFEPHVWLYSGSAEPAWDSPSLSAHPLLILSMSSPK